MRNWSSLRAAVGATAARAAMWSSTWRRRSAGTRRVAERLPGADAVLVVADAGGAERAALAAHRLLPLEQAVELVAERGRLLLVEVAELEPELEVELDRLGRLLRRHRDLRERAHADLPAALAALADRHQRASFPLLEAESAAVSFKAATAGSTFAASHRSTALSE